MLDKIMERLCEFILFVLGNGFVMCCLGWNAWLSFEWADWSNRPLSVIFTCLGFLWLFTVVLYGWYIITIRRNSDD